MCAGPVASAPVIAPERAIDEINERYGAHPGFRALHAKGTMVRGTFTPAPEAAKLTTAAHMQGPVDVTARLSNAAGNPTLPDYMPDIRGLAVTFHLPDGERTDIVSQTAPRFPVRSPDDFMELVRAQDPRAPWRLPLFLARHPRVVPTLPANLPALRPPESYATLRFYAIHAYRFTDVDGGSRYVRYTWLPEAGDHRIGPREAKRRGRDYLREDLVKRLEEGSIRFDLELQIAGEGDDPHDPTAVWSDDRERITAGTLELTGLSDTDQNTIVFDPVRVTDGIQLSDDPILNYRPRAYSASAERRMSRRP